MTTPLTQTKKLILEEFEQMRTNHYEEPIVISDDESEAIKEFISEALDEYAKAVVEELKMEKDEFCPECGMTMSHQMASVCGHHQWGIRNKAVSELNQKRNEVIESLQLEVLKTGK